MSKYEELSLAKRRERLKKYESLVIKVLHMRARRKTFQEIADTLGMKSRQYAHMVYSANVGRTKS